MCSIDEGALRGLQRKESGGRLLPAGVVRVEGLFASHQAVRLVVRRRKRKIGSTVTNPNMSDSIASIDSIDGAAPKSPIGSTSADSYNPALDPSSGQSSTFVTSPASPATAPEPHTPSIQPIMSLSSSIASLDPLSKSIPPSPATQAITERLSASNVDAGTGVKLVHELAVARGDKQVLSGGNDDEWEEEDVAKGLAQYNSAEMNRIKGLKRWVESRGPRGIRVLILECGSSHIEQVLGYVESEHVVDSITFYE